MQLHASWGKDVYPDRLWGVTGYDLIPGEPKCDPSLPTSYSYGEGGNVPVILKGGFNERLCIRFK